MSESVRRRRKMGKIKQRFRQWLSPRPTAESGTASVSAPSLLENQDPDQALRPVSAGGYTVSASLRPSSIYSSISQSETLAQPTPRASTEQHKPNATTSPSVGPPSVAAISTPVTDVTKNAPNFAVPTSLALPTLGQIVPPQSDDTGGKPVPSAAKSNQPPLWIQAFDKLSSSDQKILPPIDTDKQDYLVEVLEEVRKHRDTCQQNRWKFTFRGKDIIVRDVADKILTWVEKFKNVGDIVIQYDPAHAALPWAGLSLSDKEVMGVVMIGVERITRSLVRSTVYQELYLGSKSVISVHVGLEQALVELYTAVLEFLACTKRYLDQNIATQMLRTLLDLEGTKSKFDAIEEKESLLETELRAAQRETERQGQEMVKDLKSLLEEMEKPITRMDLNVSLIHDEFQAHIQNERRNKILKWLSKAEYEKHHRKAREGLLKDTGQWLLNKKQFRQWRSSSASGILWLSGIPGAGKTSLTCMIIDFLKSLSRSGEPVVYFYCNRNEPQRQDPEVLMQALIKQLSVEFHELLPNPVVNEYDEREKGGHAGGSLEFQESQDLIISLLNIYPQTTIIIDALDEINPSKRWQLLELLEVMISHSDSLVKIFVSSRNDIDIKLRLEKVPNLYINASDNSEDIKRFVVREVTNSIENRRLLYGVVPDPLKEQIISTIVEGANGMFQWADLQIKNLYKFRLPEEVRERLGKLPETLEETYSQIWKEISSGTPDEQEVTEKALMWVMCSKKPLLQEEWAEFSYWPKQAPQNGVNILFDLCRNFVAWDEQLCRVIFAHLSVQEYLENRNFSLVDANSMAAESCLLFLRNPAHWLESEGTVYLFQGSMFARYSAACWAFHVERCYDDNTSARKHVRDLLLDFLGTAAKPGPLYQRWLMGGYVQKKELERLGSVPPNPFFAMACFRFGELLQELWEHDEFDVESKNNLGETLLFVAAMQGYEWATNFLIGKGANINAERLDGTSVLMGAIKNSQGWAVAKLSNSGAKASAWGFHYTNILEAVAKEGSNLLMREIVTKDIKMEITKEVVIEAVGNPRYGYGMMETLLNRDPNIEVTEAVMVVAAGHERLGLKITEMLLARDVNIEITEAVLVAAAENPRLGYKLTEKLLARGTNIEITEAFLVAALGNPRLGQKLTEILLAKDVDIEITEAVLAAAVGNPRLGYKLTEMLLARGTNIRITEAVLVLAVANLRLGYKITEILLARGINIQITEKVLEVAAGNPRLGHSITKMLLAKGTDVQITEAVMVAATRNPLSLMIIELLLARDANIQIPEAVVVTAAGNSRPGYKLMQMLLARDNNIEVTEAVVVAAAGNSRSGGDIMKMLLSKSGNIVASEAFIKAKTIELPYGEEITKMLLARGTNFEAPSFDQLNSSTVLRSDSLPSSIESSDDDTPS